MFSILNTFGSGMDESKLDKSKITIETHSPVYITMSTIPSRLKTTFKIIENMLNNISGIEKLILNVPFRYNRWPNMKLDLTHNITDGRFILNRCEDHGPLTKFLPTLSLVPDNSILIIRDDMCYQLKSFKEIAEIQDRRRSESFSFFVYKYNNKNNNEDNKNVLVPQGADLISMYVRNVKDFPFWFSNLKRKLGVKNYFENPCFFVDDQVIGWYFQYIGIPMVQVDRKHRYIYIKDCDKGPEHDNLNKQKGQHSRENTMMNCYSDLSKIYPL